MSTTFWLTLVILLEAAALVYLSVQLEALSTKNQTDVADYNRVAGQYKTPPGISRYDPSLYARRKK